MSILTAVNQSLSCVKHGYRPQDKARFVGIILLRLLFLKAIRHKFIVFDKYIDQMIGSVWRGSVVTIRSKHFALVDYESFLIVTDTFEQFLKPWLKLGRGQVFVDVGAHVGKYTIHAGQIVGSHGKVIAIEPDPVNFKMLQKNVYLNRLRNVITLNIAAWNHDTKLRLFMGTNTSLNTVKQQTKKYTIVQARKLDGVIEELGLPRIDWIKIDVEGADWEVLEGLNRTLEKYRPKMIIEVSEEILKRFQALMEQLSYRVTQISDFDQQYNHRYFYCIDSRIAS